MKMPREIILAQHRDAEEKLKTIQASDLAALVLESSNVSTTIRCSFSVTALATRFWLEAIAPWRRAWMAMAAIWMVILVVNVSGGSASKSNGAAAAKMDPQARIVLLEQKKMLAQLLEPMTPLPQKTLRPGNFGPRSDMKIEEAMV